VGAAVGASAGAIKEKIWGGNMQAGAKFRKKGAEQGRKAGAVAGSTVEGAGKGVRHMMANPHGNPVMYGASALRHGYNKGKGRLSGVEGATPSAEANPIEETPTDRQTISGTYRRDHSEWGTGNREVGFISPDDSSMALPVRTHENDNIDHSALEDGDRVEMAQMERTTTTQGSAGSHDKSEPFPPDTDGEEYTTFVPSSDTELRRLD